MQLPNVDSTKFNGIDGDKYAIDAKGDTDVIDQFLMILEIHSF